MRDRYKELFEREMPKLLYDESFSEETKKKVEAKIKEKHNTAKAKL